MTMNQRARFAGLAPSFMTARAGFASSFAVAVVPAFFIPDDEGDADAEWIELFRTAHLPRIYSSRFRSRAANDDDWAGWSLLDGRFALRSRGQCVWPEFI